MTLSQILNPLEKEKLVARFHFNLVLEDTTLTSTSHNKARKG